MSSVTPRQTSFNGGQISPRMHGRIDQNIYSISLEHMVGFLPLLQGPAEACPGFEVLNDCKGPSRCIPFEFNVTQGYVIEAGQGYFRFWTNGGLILSSGSPYEIASPYTYAQVQRLFYVQSADVLYLFHPEVQPRKLTRTSATTFALTAIDFKQGPFERQNSDQSVVVSASGVTGAITLECSTGIFAAGDVGGLFRIEAGDLGDIPSWEPGITIAVGQLRQWSDRVYRVAGVGAGGKTGTVPPIHGEGVEWDGMGSGTDINDKNAGGVQWEYLHDRFGIVKITAFTDAQTVSGTVQRRLPFTSSGNYDYTGGYRPGEETPWEPIETGVGYAYGTWRWAFGAYSPRRGWPSCGAIWNERLIVAKDSTIDGSVIGDFENMAAYNEFGAITLDMAFRVTIPNPNPIRWLLAETRLMIGTANAEYVLGPSNAANGVGPGNISIDIQSSAGSAVQNPVIIDGRAVFVQRAKRKILEFGYQLQRDRYETPDLTRFADDIGDPGFVELAWAKEPEKHLWACRADGSLAAALYLPTEQALGWSVRPLGGGLQGKSICAISDEAGERDEVHCIAQLGSRWLMMRLGRVRHSSDADEDIIMSDAAGRYDGDPVTTISGIDWLAGREVEILADGKYAGRRPVSALGVLTLPYAASKVTFGLPFPAYMQLLELEAGGDSGPAQGKLKRIYRMAVRVWRSMALAVEVHDEDVGTLPVQRSDSLFDEPFEARTGEDIFEPGGVHDRRGRIRITRVAPHPSTVLAVTAFMTVEQR
jgi:hypothetical protein